MGTLGNLGRVALGVGQEGFVVVGGGGEVGGGGGIGIDTRRRDRPEEGGGRTSCEANAYGGREKEGACRTRPSRSGRDQSSRSRPGLCLARCFMDKDPNCVAAGRIRDG